MKKREEWMIKTSGIQFDDIKDWNAEILSLSTQLTEEERNSKFAKYYFREIKMPAHEYIAAAELCNPLPTSCVIRPEDYIKVMDSPEIEKIKTGYCVAEDGTGFSVIRIIQEGVTDEKIAYFNEHFNPEGDLFYKCWYPGMHMRHYEGGAIEDTGSGMELIHFNSPVLLEELTGPDYRIKDPLFVGFAGGGGESWPLHNPFHHTRYNIQVDWWRDLPDGSGREEFIVFWNGVKWVNGKGVSMIPEGEKINIEYVRALMNHCIWENMQTIALINSFWDDNH